MAGYRLRFGTYDLPRSCRPAEDAPGSIETGRVARLRAPGSVTKEGRPGPRLLTVRGEWVSPEVGSLDGFIEVADELIARCGDGKQDLWFGRDDRYYKNAQLLTPGLSYPKDGVTYGVFGVVTLTFEAADYPEAFGTVAHAPALASNGGTFTAQGDAPALALPTYTITINAGGSGPLTLTSTTTGEFCTVARPGGAAFVGGDVIVLDRDGCTATLNGVAIVGLWDRRIPHIACGRSNTITLASAGTATVASLAVSYPPRYR
jgi:hypothetical protein